MIYVIGSCELRDHKEECIVVKNKSFTIEEMTNIVGALSNLYCYKKNEKFCMPKELLYILCDKLQCKERKYKYRGELEFLERRIQTPMLHTTFVFCGELVIWIGIKEAMGYTRGRMWEIINTYMPKEEIDKIEAEWRRE